MNCHAERRSYELFYVMSQKFPGRTEDNTKDISRKYKVPILTNKLEAWFGCLIFKVCDIVGGITGGSAVVLKGLTVFSGWQYAD